MATDLPVIAFRSGQVRAFPSHVASSPDSRGHTVSVRRATRAATSLATPKRFPLRPCLSLPAVVNGDHIVSVDAVESPRTRSGKRRWRQLRSAVFCVARLSRPDVSVVHNVEDIEEGPDKTTTGAHGWKSKSTGVARVTFRQMSDEDQRLEVSSVPERGEKPSRWEPDETVGIGLGLQYNLTNSGRATINVPGTPPKVIGEGVRVQEGGVGVLVEREEVDGGSTGGTRVERERARVGGEGGGEGGANGHEMTASEIAAAAVAAAAGGGGAGGSAPRTNFADALEEHRVRERLFTAVLRGAVSFWRKEYTKDPKRHMFEGSAAGSNLNALNRHGHTQLHTAAQNGDLQMVANLLRHGADLFLPSKPGLSGPSVKKPPEGELPLQVAARWGHLDLVLFLLLLDGGDLDAYTARVEEKREMERKRRLKKARGKGETQGGTAGDRGALETSGYSFRDHAFTTQVTGREGEGGEGEERDQQEGRIPLGERFAPQSPQNRQAPVDVNSSGGGGGGAFGGAHPAAELVPERGRSPSHSRSIAAASSNGMSLTHFAARSRSVPFASAPLTALADEDIVRTVRGRRYTLATLKSAAETAGSERVRAYLKEHLKARQGERSCYSFLFSCGSNNRHQGSLASGDRSRRSGGGSPHEVSSSTEWEVGDGEGKERGNAS
uniref:Uncharacterized protein n=1 Tax=Chromera velia CCMP2878 TaxID=1169474 RepID=A0A0G4HLV9_9ALVE|eukprot:Cvel_7401.t1-p1 / transcript=Cvel_7401.t1 / gene=Cvel_7401 / organism=Chromera_velia_CCMP2878 / gene_product=hypothetical protein / transcript_product=hypothetical protein / location=Cvel_scaffold386:29562-34288(-) / protein_length=665 / sequence_SO=supercontig / SO=protein_coding / is_pseudo=false